MADIIGGINPVLEALKARGGDFQRIYAARGRSGKAFDEIVETARSIGVGIQWVEKSRLDKLFGRTSHQGVVAQVGPYTYYDLADIINRVRGATGLVLILDGVQDPMNLGSLIRSADAAGAAGVVIPRERAAPVTPAAVKASAGASEHVPVARVVNLPQSVDILKSEGFWILGLDAAAEESVYDRDLKMKLGLVVGAEGKGIGTLMKKKCDGLISLPLRGEVSSLNAAVAGALAMFEFVRQTRS